MYMDSSDCDIAHSPKNNYIDEITLELLINKQCKTKYLMQHDPQKFKETEEFKDKMAYYKQDIIGAFYKYMDNDGHQVCSEMDDAFEIFVKACFKHFEIQEVAQENNYFNEDKDDNVLFQNVNAFTQAKSNSFWGKGVKKI